jgi:uncharacterized protein (TIGR03067 family)
MRQMFGCAAFLAVAFPVLADDAGDAAKKLNGTYEVASVKGEAKDKKDLPTFTFKDGTITISEGAGKSETATFKVDAGKKPAQIDIMPNKGKGETVLGIYEQKGMELTIAFVHGGGGTRPKDFKGEGKGEVVLTLKKKS